uniref:Peptidase S1 domain-containing protein n=1 Tax=Heliothis virescens TaxID=7102 RepID=A0A2A4JAU5_HELVI
MGGRDAIEVDYPYIVKLELQTVMYRVPKIIKNEHICTAGVLTPTWTLTAAHCLTLKTKKVRKLISMVITIRYGTLENSTTSNILYAITHPAYRLTTDRIQNDIGLLKTEAIPLAQYARVSALDFATMVGQEAALTGFGLTNNAEGVVGDARWVNKPLQILDVVIVRCDRDKSVMKPSMCLARRCDKSAGMCPGDSGGPMIHASGIVGVNSLGPSELGTLCLMKSTDPVYDTAEVTPISPFIDWITDTTNKDDDDVLY